MMSTRMSSRWFRYLQIAACALGTSAGTLLAQEGGSTGQEAIDIAIPATEAPVAADVEREPEPIGMPDPVPEVLPFPKEAEVEDPEAARPPDVDPALPEGGPGLPEAIPAPAEEPVRPRNVGPLGPAPAAAPEAKPFETSFKAGFNKGLGGIPQPGGFTVRAGNGNIDTEMKGSLDPFAGARGDLEFSAKVGNGSIETRGKGDFMLGSRLRGSIEQTTNLPGGFQVHNRLEGKVLQGLEGDFDHESRIDRQGLDYRMKGGFNLGSTIEGTSTNRFTTPLGTVTDKTNFGGGASVFTQVDQQFTTAPDKLVLKDKVRAGAGAGIWIENEKSLEIPGGPSAKVAGYFSPGKGATVGRDLDISLDREKKETRVGAGFIAPFGAISAGGSAELTVTDANIQQVVRSQGPGGALAARALTPVLDAGTRAVNNAYQNTVRGAGTAVQLAGQGARTAVRQVEAAGNTARDVLIAPFGLGQRIWRGSRR